MFSLASRTLARSASTSFARSFATQHLVVTGTGIDRAGLIAETSSIVNKAGCTIGESRSMKLGGHFSVMLLASGEDSDVEKLSKSLAASKVLDFKTTLTTDPAVVEATPAEFGAEFMLEGADRPGLVNDMAKILAKHGMNIERVETTAEDAASHGGTVTFQMQGVATHPGPLDEDWTCDAIRDELEEWAESQNCEVSFEDYEDDMDMDEWDDDELEKVR